MHFIKLYDWGPQLKSPQLVQFLGKNSISTVPYRKIDQKHHSVLWSFTDSQNSLAGPFPTSPCQFQSMDLDGRTQNLY